MNAGGLQLSIPGILEVKANQPVAMRAFVIEGNTARFHYDALQTVSVQVNAPGTDRAIQTQA